MDLGGEVARRTLDVGPRRLLSRDVPADGFDLPVVTLAAGSYHVNGVVRFGGAVVGGEHWCSFPSLPSRTFMTPNPYIRLCPYSQFGIRIVNSLG